MDAGYTATESDGFVIESNATPPPEAAPVVDDLEVEAAGGEQAAETAEAKPALARDEKGRFAAAKADEAIAETTEEPEAEVAADEPKKTKPRDDPQARIAQAVARQREAERKAAELERRMADLESRVAPKPEPAKPEPAPTKFPRFDAWLEKNPAGNFDDYLEARDDFNATALADRIAQRAAEQQQKAAYQRDRQQVVDRFVAAVDQAGADVFDSIDARVRNVPYFDNLKDRERPTWRHYVGEEFLQSEAPIALMQYFSDHLDEFQALASLPPRGITRRIAQIEKDLTRPTAASATGTASKPPAISQAKPPVKPVTGSPSTTADDLSEDTDLETHIRVMNARDRKAGRL